MIKESIKMKKNISKMIAGLMSAALLLSGVSVSAKADTGALSMINSFLDDAKIKGAETVYVITDTKGNPEKIMESKNSSKAKEIEGMENLPIKMTATYKLDGKEIEAADIEGATGKLTIRFDYVNTKETTVKIDCKEENVHIPFTVTAGMVVDKKEFTNIEVSNGKTVSDGDKVLVVGMAYPSLASDLKLTDSELKIYDYIEINADVKNAKWTNVYTVVSNTVFSAFSEDMGSTLDTNSLQSLMDGVEQLTDGSRQLSEGLGTLSDSTDKLKSGVTALNSGLGTLNANSAKINAGADQVFNSMLNTANNTIAQTGATLPKLTIDNYGTVLGGAITALTAKGDTKTAASLTGLKAQLDSFNTFYQGVKSYTAGVDSAYAGSKQLNASMPALSEGVTKLEDGAVALNGGIEELNEKTVGRINSEKGEDAANVYTRFKAISGISSEYSSFDSTSYDTENYVSFVYKMKKN